MRDLQLREKISLALGALSAGRFLRRTPHWAPEHMRAWQFARLQKLVAHAFARVPFYRDLYRNAGFQPGDLKTWDDFRKLPTITKNQVIENYPSRMIAEGYDPESLIISRSSGSSGQVLDIAYDQKGMVTFVLAGLRLYKMGFQYRPWHRQVYVYTSPYPLDSLFGLYPLHFLSTLAPLAELIASLRKSKPDLLVCYPSHLKAISQEMTADDRRTIRPRAISVNSEMSTQAERDSLAEFFGCPVLDEYSSEELTRIAAQCLHKRYHLFEDINLIETLDSSGLPTNGFGLIVGTNLHHFAMPMIRYQQNDLGEIHETLCPCGWRFRELRNLQGRRNDSFVMPSGKELNSGFLLDATYEFLLSHRTAIRDFCLIQHSVERVVLQIVPGQGWNDAVAENIAGRFRGFLEPGMTFAIEIVAECWKTRTGKRNPIINLMRRQNEPPQTVDAGPRP